jgi:hypothetical protein
VNVFKSTTVALLLISNKVEDPDLVFTPLEFSQPSAKPVVMIAVVSDKGNG